MLVAANNMVESQVGKAGYAGEGNSCTCLSGDLVLEEVAFGLGVFEDCSLVVDLAASPDEGHGYLCWIRTMAGA